MPTLRQRIEGGLVGLLIGDALGVPYEFNAPEHLPPPEEIAFDPPPGFRRSHAETPPGTWSDDGALALCLLDSLLECGRFDAEDFGRRMLRWLHEGYLAVDGRVFDVGITTSRALSDIRGGAPALRAGPVSESSNGNGSLMRVLPLALWHRGPDSGLAIDALAQSRVTHGHLRSQLCCAVYCLWARRLLQDHPAPYRDAVETVRGLFANAPEVLHEIDTNIRPFAAPNIAGSGYVVDCLRSAREAVEDGGGYERVVKSAICMGHDTDTTGCVAGGIAGLQAGIDGIPAAWRASLRGEDLYRPLLGGLLDHLGESGA